MENYEPQESQEILMSFKQIIFFEIHNASQALHMMSTRRIIENCFTGGDMYSVQIKTTKQTKTLGIHKNKTEEQPQIRCAHDLANVRLFLSISIAL